MRRQPPPTSPPRPRAQTPPDDAAFRASAAGSRSVSPLQRLRVRAASRSSPLAPRPVRLAPARAAVTPDKGIFKKLSPKTVAAGYEAAGRLQRSRLLEARLLEARAPECLLRPLCNISLELPTDPVVACDGHVYERSAISEWIGRSAVLGADPVSPVSGERMASGPLATSFQTRERIEALVRIASRGPAADSPLENSPLEKRWLARQQADAEAAEAARILQNVTGAAALGRLGPRSHHC